MKVAVLIEQKHMDTLKKACAIAAEHSEIEFATDIAHTLGHLILEFEKY